MKSLKGTIKRWLSYSSIVWMCALKEKPIRAKNVQP